MTAPQTPSQTVGPFFHMRLGAEGEDRLVPGDAPGLIHIRGRLVDAEGDPIGDGLIELWQADREGRYRHPFDRSSGGASIEPGFTGFGRAATDADSGEFRFETVKPGQVPHPEGGMQAPHLSLIVQARGMLNPSFTRLYFPDEAAANEADPVLATVPPRRRGTLLAERLDADEPTYRFDIAMGGDDETVFFDF